MVLGTIIAIIILAIYSIAITILNYKEKEFSDKMISDYSTLNLDFVRALNERDNLKKEIEKQKDVIADLSRQINEATVKKVPDESPSEAKSEKPKKETKSKTTKKTTTRKTTTKKKEVKE